MSDGQRISPFEAIRRTAEDGGEYWSARELMVVLDYTEWRNFTRVLTKAREACQNSGNAVSDHFVETNKMVTLGSGATREVTDYDLSRYACYLVVQNGDPEKPVIAAGQTYFAVRTREAELAEELTGLSEAQRRLVLRDQVKNDNTTLAAVAYGAGVLTQSDFAIFQDHGYRGLYAGETAADIHARKGLKKSQRILDHMGSEELSGQLLPHHSDRGEDRA